MEKKQVLSIEQMQHLQELGLKLKDAMIYWSKPHKGVICRCGDDWFLSFADDKTRKFFEVIPAYTLQDVLDALPEYIYDSTEQYLLEINMFFKYIRYSRFNDVLTKRNFDRTPIIDAAYELLVWAIENGYVETDKNK